MNSVDLLEISGDLSELSVDLSQQNDLKCWDLTVKDCSMIRLTKVGDGNFCRSLLLEKGKSNPRISMGISSYILQQLNKILGSGQKLWAHPTKKIAIWMGKT